MVQVSAVHNAAVEKYSAVRNVAVDSVSVHYTLLKCNTAGCTMCPVICAIAHVVYTACSEV